ncbi:FliH/SctL family protein [Pseudoduganella chitinolytica]|uniref:Flagellar assembly protein FliH n=1 Tax=Pseudoduganella chitinolytica TaxID=34070 RepID=A0ABY8BA96_9BURK|nr:FliH/SctL family protein [Pseudoduganella chitinolytica]WEF32850.1 FliH/SctL family protein [Pseudoduganella chitinolytica]
MDPIIRAAALTAIPRPLRRPDGSAATVAPAASIGPAVAVEPVESVRPAVAVLPELGESPQAAPPSGPTPAELAAAAEAELARARQVLADAQAQHERWQAEQATGQEQLAAAAADLVLREEALQRDRAALDAACASARDEAASRGYEEGLASGTAEGRAGVDAAMARHLAQLEDIVAQAAEARERLLAGHEDMLVEVAYAAICRLAGAAASSRAGALAQVRTAVAQVREADGVRVRLHPDDVAWLAPQAGEQHSWALLADERVELGGCIVEGGHGSLDARLELQLERLRAALLAARAARAAEV